MLEIRTEFLESLKYAFIRETALSLSLFLYIIDKYFNDYKIIPSENIR